MHAASVDAVGAMAPPSLSSQSTGDLVSELSQAEYHLRAWSGLGTPGWELRAGIDLTSLRVRGQEIRQELRDRGLDFPEVSSHQPEPRDSDNAPEQPDPVPDAQAGITEALTSRVWHLERALLTRTVIGQATGLLMERHSVTADQAFAMLRNVSSVTNRKLWDIAVELVETRIMPRAVAPEGRDASRGARRRARSLRR